MKSLRLFIALNFPKKFKEELGLLTAHLKNLPVRWTDPKNQHLTLVFLGYVPAEKLMKVISATSRAVKGHKALQIKFQTVETGPPGAPARLVWAKGERNPDLDKIYQDLMAELENIVSIAKKPGEKTVLPHVTLGRIKKEIWAALPQKPEVNEPISLDAYVSRVDLMQSRLSRRGADYDILQSWELP